ncbi:IS66 family transposase [Polyangium jinanense]|uniref:IS66 family transposase n=1 Tax=Polyangium jinanense TaxID=2829994 RepID=UPI00233FC96C|nr:IS66 family transposase [Polyangium jinanense]MDC3960740.1 IS66 family transposase [Polyangium jinanense]
MTNPELEAKVVVLESRLAGASRERDKLSHERDKFRHERDEYRKLYELASIELERFRRHIFGRKAEQIDPAQTQLAFTAVVEALGGLERLSEQTPDAAPPSDRPSGEKLPDGKKPKQKDRKVTPHGRQILPEHLPVHEIELLPPEAKGEGAASLVRIGEEVSETLEWRPASLVRVRVIRPKFATKGKPEEGVRVEPAPEAPIPRCMAGPGLIAHVIVSKYGNSLPLHRQERIFEREGVSLARSTLCNWVGASTGLLKYVVDAMLVDAKTAHCIAMDATGVLVQAKEKCRRGYFWVLVADQDHVLFRFTPRHTQDGPREFLRGYKGYVLADAHNVYELLYRTEDVTEVGCWAHCRRGFFKSLSSDKERALAALGFIGKLYAIDAETKELPPARRTEERRRLATPVLEAFRIWLDVEALVALPKSPIGQAIGYARNQWAPLTRFLDDGRLRLDNNGSELELRRQAVGRKNWLFVGSDEGAEWNTIAVSLIASCQLHGIEPWAYLRDVLILLPDWPRDRVLELSPKHWKQTLEQTDARERLDRGIWRRISSTPPSS